jgi:glycosyltransferase involved in cell wall biosynthesis
MVNDIMVSVSMITYKHEQYIQQAIEGVLMQQTDFNYELIIADDCSPDNTEEIVKNIIQTHPNGHVIKYFRHETNIGMQPNGTFAGEQCKGKYIAICEGDDYWIDPLKLQKQVDFLEHNPEYGLVHTDLNILNQRTGRTTKRVEKNESNELLLSRDISEMIAYGSYSIYTCTVLLKKELLNKFNNNQQQMLGDLPLFLHLSEITKFKFINEVTSIYRLHFDSATRPKSLIQKMAFEIAAIEVSLNFLSETKSEPTFELKDKYRSKVIKYHKLTGLNLGKNHKKYFNTKEWIELNNPGNQFVRWVRVFYFQIKNLRHNLYRLYYFFNPGS